MTMSSAVVGNRQVVASVDYVKYTCVEVRQVSPNTIEIDVAVGPNKVATMHVRNILERDATLLACGKSYWFRVRAYDERLVVVNIVIDESEYLVSI